MLNKEKENSLCRNFLDNPCTVLKMSHNMVWICILICRCDIPVIIMGETGCGKTRLVKYMCALQVPPGAEATNMILMKVNYF